MSTSPKLGLTQKVEEYNPGSRHHFWVAACLQKLNFKMHCWGFLPSGMRVSARHGSLLNLSSEERGGGQCAQRQSYKQGCTLFSGKIRSLTKFV